MSKILFHHNCLEQGGAERVISNLANSFSKNGDEIIVATEWQGENEFVLNSEVRRIHVGLSEADERKNRISKILIRVKNLRNLIKSEKPDIVLGFTRKPLFRALMASMGLKVPVVVAVRSDPFYEYDNFADRMSVRFLFPRADGAVFQTKMQKSFFPKYIQKKSVIILNPVNAKYFTDCSESNKEKLVVSTGRLVELKNQAMLLKAFIRIHNEYPDYTLKLFGEDSGDGTKEKLEKIIADNNADEYIKLMGGSDSLEKELAKAEVFAFASDSEGMPNSILEAMCMGLPVVATDCPCGGPATIIQNNINGILTPVGDEEAFAEAIISMLSNKDKAREMGEKAKEIRKMTSGDSITRAWRDYIDKVIGEKNV